MKTAKLKNCWTASIRSSRRKPPGRNPSERHHRNNLRPELLELHRNAIYGQDQIFCGNINSTQWLVTEYKASNMAGSIPQYCCLNTGDTFNPATSQRCQLLRFLLALLPSSPIPETGLLIPSDCSSLRSLQVRMITAGHWPKRENMKVDPKGGE